MIGLALHECEGINDCSGICSSKGPVHNNGILQCQGVFKIIQPRFIIISGPSKVQVCTIVKVIPVIVCLHFNDIGNSRGNEIKHKAITGRCIRHLIIYIQSTDTYIIIYSRGYICKCHCNKCILFRGSPAEHIVQGVALSANGNLITYGTIIDKRFPVSNDG